MLESKNKVNNLMNLVMQFRKVCNHPELFERRTNRSPCLFNMPYYLTFAPCRQGEPQPVLTYDKSAIGYVFSKLVHEELCWAFKERELAFGRHLLSNAANVYARSWEADAPLLCTFVGLLGLPYHFLEFVWRNDQLFSAIVTLHYL